MSERAIVVVCSCLIIGRVPVVVVEAQQDASLMGWWKLDETAGTVAADSASGGFNGTLIGNPQWTGGQLAGGLQLDGDGDYVDLGADFGSVIASLTDVSCSAWVKFANVGGYWQRVFDFGVGPTVYMFLTAKGQVGSGQTPIIFGLGHNGWTDEDRIECTDTFPNGCPDGWHHLAVTVDYTNRVGRVYVDAELAGENAEMRYGAPTLGATTQNWLGRSQYEGDAYFNGVLDEFRIYDYALTQEDLQVAMQGGSLASFIAYRPKPADKQKEVPRQVVLSWKRGLYGNTRNVYMGTSFEDVNEASVLDPRGVLIAEDLAATTLDVGTLEYGLTYYWRVDEVNAPPDLTVRRGRVWSFTVLNFLVVDGFETYTDEAPNRVFDTWKDGWQTLTNGAVVGYSDADPDAGEHFLESSVIHGGEWSMPYSYDTGMKYSEAWLPLTGIERDWTREGVTSLSLWFRGHLPYLGGFSEDAPGTCTVQGAGEDIWGGADQFHFAYKEYTGAMTITAKVESLDDADPFAKAGVMIRDSLEAGSTNVAVLITPENGVRFQYRLVADDATEREFVEGITAPYWIRIQRTSGGLVRAYYSPSGADNTWTQFTLKTMAAISGSLYVGLAVTSHVAAVPAKAVFSNVSLTGTAATAPWSDQDVGIVSNAPEPLYVALNDTAVVYSDPNVTLADTWTRWQIPLTAFSDQGLDLTQVEKMAIGVGIKGDSTSPGGTGLLYFDDIRLYRPDVAQ
jgi:hypothetical protein